MFRGGRGVEAIHADIGAEDVLGMICSRCIYALDLSRSVDLTLHERNLALERAGRNFVGSFRSRGGAGNTKLSFLYARQKGNVLPQQPLRPWQPAGREKQPRDVAFRGGESLSLASESGKEPGVENATPNSPLAESLTY
jgi:hypothetical protein